ncbi:MAG: flagellar hook basal-body protein [Candidatus Calescibacterium sp.]|nr:flagellar hook basal-body protein [Candidatus Calescibacterium sp.]MCX7972174.1 flagellar hook basal-body protein [bacterium]MDW8194864.1 flagellar hook basal-body protein [Candidatus Calescibacterium sp.]
MFSSFYTAASGMEAQLKKVEILSQNLANANSISYKQQRISFQELMYQKIDQMNIGTGTKIGEVERVFKIGAMERTNSPLDVAIQGRGFFKVQTPEGKTVYTRDGRFNVENGELVIKDIGKTGIKVPQDVTGVTIEEDGTVVGYKGKDKVEIGKIKIYDFVNPNGLKGIGKNAFEWTENAGKPIEIEPGKGDNPKIAAGFLEKSNVNVITQMMDIVSSQRNYELVAKCVESADQIARMANQMKKH